MQKTFLLFFLVFFPAIHKGKFIRCTEKHPGDPKGIQVNKDELLQRALQYIRTGK
jgi:hypothetical protein